jgi:hypothetical protein
LRWSSLLVRSHRMLLLSYVSCIYASIIPSLLFTFVLPSRCAPWSSSTSVSEKAWHTHTLTLFRQAPLNSSHTSCDYCLLG